MVIKINNNPKELPDQYSLQQLVDLENIDSRGLAIAINEEIIPKMEWEKKFLKDQDQLIMIRATQGG